MQGKDDNRYVGGGGGSHQSNLKGLQRFGSIIGKANNTYKQSNEENFQKSPLEDPQQLETYSNGHNSQDGTPPNSGQHQNSNIMSTFSKRLKSLHKQKSVVNHDKQQSALDKKLAAAANGSSAVEGAPQDNMMSKPEPLKHQQSRRMNSFSSDKTGEKKVTNVLVHMQRSMKINTPMESKESLMKVGIGKQNNAGSLNSQQTRNAILGKVLQSHMQNNQAQDLLALNESGKSTKNQGAPLFSGLTEALKKQTFVKKMTMAKDTANASQSPPTHSESSPSPQPSASKQSAFSKIVNQVQKANIFISKQSFKDSKKQKTSLNQEESKQTSITMQQAQNSKINVNQAQSVFPQINQTDQRRQAYQQEIPTKSNQIKPMLQEKPQENKNTAPSRGLTKQKTLKQATNKIVPLSQAKNVPVAPKEKSPQNRNQGNINNLKDEEEEEESSDSFGTDSSFEEEEDDEDQVVALNSSQLKDQKTVTTPVTLLRKKTNIRDDQLAKQFIMITTLQQQQQSPNLNKSGLVNKSQNGESNDVMKTTPNPNLVTPGGHDVTDNLLSPNPQGTRPWLTTEGGGPNEGDDLQFDFQTQTNRALLNNQNTKQGSDPFHHGLSKRNTIQGNKDFASLGIETLENTSMSKRSKFGVISKVKNFFRQNEINSGNANDKMKGKNSLSQSQSSYDDYYAQLLTQDGYRLRDIHKEASKMWMLFPDDNIKIRWEMMMSVVLIFTAVTTPLLLAFSEKDDEVWTSINNTVDALFGIDIIVCFFSAFEDENEELVYDRKKIAMTYIKSWFFIDLLSILPVSDLMQTGDFSNLARIARLPKLYRLIRMVKLIRIMKIVKERNTISKYLNEVLKVSVALERLSFFCFIFMMLVHIISCFWVIIATFEDDPNNLINRNGMLNYSPGQLYLACFYYTTVIVTTIGYGDITTRTAPEQIFTIILLITGVVGFSFAIGSLSSVLSSLDAKAGKLAEKMETLNHIKEDYRISYELYRRLRSAVTYGHSKNTDEQQQFVNDLPNGLKVELSVVMHQDLMITIKFFKHKSPHFIAFIMPFLRPVKSDQGQYIYKEGDPVDEIYFLSSGQAAYVQPNYNDAVYVIIEAGYYFGEIDFIFVDQDGNADGKRKFTAKSLVDSELFLLMKTDLLKVDEEFEDVISELFSNATQRLKKILKLQKKSKQFYKKLLQQRQDQAKLDEQQMIMSAQQSNGSNPSLSAKIFHPFSSGIHGGSKDYKENDQNAFIDDLKKKNLIMNNQRIKHDMLDTMDDGVLDESSSVIESSPKAKRRSQMQEFDSDESQEGGGRRSSSDKMDGGDDDYKFMNSSPDKSFEPQIDNVDESSSSRRGEQITEMEGQDEFQADQKSENSEGESERVADSSDEDHKKSVHTAYFHNGPQAVQTNNSESYHQKQQYDNFTTVANEKGYDFRNPDGKLLDTPSSAKQGGPVSFLRNKEQNQTEKHVGKTKGSVMSISQMDSEMIPSQVNEFEEQVNQHQAPTNTLGCTSQKETDRAGASAQLGSISESIESESDYSEEENEEIKELDKKDTIGKDKKRSHSVLNDLKLGGQTFVVGGGLRKQPTMIQPTRLHGGPQISPDHLQIPKTRLQMRDFGSSGGTRGGDPSLSSASRGGAGGTPDFQNMNTLGSPSSRRRETQNEEDDGVQAWKNARYKMSKKTSTQQALAPLKGPQAVTNEFNKIKEIKKRKRSNAHLALGGYLEGPTSNILVKQDSMTLTEVNYQLLRQIETDNGNMYNQLIGRINQFETMLVEISSMMQDLNEHQLQMRESVEPGTRQHKQNSSTGSIFQANLANSRTPNIQV